MHRSYNPITPASSKLLQKRWDEHHYNKHRQSVNAVKPEIDSSPPITFMHLHLKLKKLQLEEERLATIERDNRILLEKMSQIMRTRGRIDNANDIEYKSLSRGRRQRELLRISKENVRMMRRITGKKSSLSVETLERDWRRNLRYMDNISAFPEEWYLMKEGSQSARPGLTNRSATGKQNKPNQENNDHDHSDSDRKESRSKSVNNRNNENSEKKPSLAIKEKKSSVSPRKSEPNEKKASDDEKKYDDDFEEN